MAHRHPIQQSKGTDMKRKLIWLTLITLLLTTLVGSDIAQAQKSTHYNLTLNSLAGGNYGGGTFTSDSYTMIVSLGNLINVSSSSAGYELCSGFICQSDKSYFQLRLPAVDKSPE